MIICLCLLFAGRASAQWVVSDPGNLAQGIINASKNIIHTSKTATNMVSNFQETVKIYQQGKKYYDALKSVNNLVKDARKVQQTILMVGDITDIYVNSFQRMLRDGNFRPEELSAIAFGYTKLLEESNEVLTELRNVAQAAAQTEFITSGPWDGDQLVYFTCLPWFPLTALKNEKDVNPSDSVPRAAWGRWEEEGSRTRLLLSLELNHRLLDGVHVGRFYEALNRWMEGL